MRSRCSRMEEELRTAQVREALAIRSLLWFGVASPHVCAFVFDQHHRHHDCVRHRTKKKKVNQSIYVRMSDMEVNKRRIDKPVNSRRRNQEVPSPHRAHSGTRAVFPLASRLVAEDTRGLEFLGRRPLEGDFSSLQGDRSGSRTRRKRRKRRSSRSSRSGGSRAIYECESERRRFIEYGNERRIRE